tara:strand:- start:384 stop:830 length:447 start_codon:yes stop_codon:yes gene_type:complete
MNFIDQVFLKCVDIIEYIGNLSGLGYELTNIFLFVILQPLLIIIFLILWLKERKKNRKLASHIFPTPKSKLVYFFWRLSRLLSILVLVIEFITVSIYFEIFPITNIKSELIQDFENSLIAILLISPIAILLTYNFLIFGKITIWLKKP